MKSTPQMIEDRETWAKALESGEFDQCTHAMCRDVHGKAIDVPAENKKGYSHCCLHVAVIALNYKGKYFTPLYDRLGIIDSQLFVNFNDHQGLSFKQIAHKIRTDSSLFI